MNALLLVLKLDSLDSLRKYITSITEIEIEEYAPQSVYDERLLNLLDDYISDPSLDLSLEESDAAHIESLVLEALSELVAKLEQTLGALPDFKPVRIYGDKVILAISWRAI